MLNYIFIGLLNFHCIPCHLLGLNMA